MFNYKGVLVSLLLVFFVNSNSNAVIESSKIKGLNKTKSESVLTDKDCQSGDNFNTLNSSYSWIEMDEIEKGYYFREYINCITNSFYTFFNKPHDVEKQAELIDKHFEIFQPLVKISLIYDLC